MYKGKRINVLIAAAGSGVRMSAGEDTGANIPKQFIDICGEPMLRVAAEAFERNEYIDDIYVISPADFIGRSKDVLAGLSKLRGVCEGGQTRQDSVRLGLRYMAANAPQGNMPCDIVLIHDAARPFVTGEVILGVIEGVIANGSAVCCVPVKDTIYQADIGSTLRSVPPRGKLYSVQTPQGFDFALIKGAHERAAEDGVSATDDGSLAKEYGAEVLITCGSYDNVKITTVHDLPETVRISALSSASDFTDAAGDVRVGTGFDVHAFAVGRKLILGGVEIDYDRGLLGHSDADVLTHALMDAMLGALALGDIGTHFPDTDERYKGISSMKLLAEVVSIIRGKRYTVSNADMTIIAEKPRMTGVISGIRKSIADALGIAEGCVSVKATTTEGLGFTGREEGIGAQAVVALSRK
jgi:2-C-methyl-D-erythritol 2,4-cyclodiphosphate synthase/2-C-methyl-D-erythritol 4-phosphate cytidylyltransferase